jgi:hypothetical protein
MVPGRTCSNCSHFAPLAQGGPQCRAHAPTCFPMPGGPGEIRTIGMYPPTNKNEWCGEWKGEEELTSRLAVVK